MHERRGQASSNTRLVAAWLEGYRIDHGVYPPVTPYSRFFDGPPPRRLRAPASLTTVGGLGGITWSALPGIEETHRLDPAAVRGGTSDSSVAYFADSSGWVLILRRRRLALRAGGLR
mgnify:CR=1 FL=1